MSNEKTYAAANPQAAFIVPGPLDPARLRDRVYSDGLSAKIGFRILRSTPAMDLGVVADAAGMSVRELVIEVEQLRGRGRRDQLAAEAWTYPLITRAGPARRARKREPTPTRRRFNRTPAPGHRGCPSGHRHKQRSRTGAHRWFLQRLTSGGASRWPSTR